MTKEFDQGAADQGTSIPLHMLNDLMDRCEAAITLQADRFIALRSIVSFIAEHRLLCGVRVQIDLEDGSDAVEFELVDRRPDAAPLFVRNAPGKPCRAADPVANEPDAEAAAHKADSGADAADIPDQDAVQPQAPKAAVVPSGGLVTGPLSDEEKQTIWQMVDQGSGAAEIAAKLRRRVQTVALLLNRAEARNAQPAPQVSRNAEQLRETNAAAQAPVKAAVSPAPKPVEDRVVRPAWWHEVSAVLDAVGHKGGWTSARDLELVEEATKGTPWEIIADQLGIEKREAKSRFIALTPDGVSFEKQSRLIEVLRSIVAAQV
ncbi:hypothetical protein [Pontitalea aquivivens]|uniref:hypothetical protein n=1 Tax=Pontitalea aquivivens TaxID=3388663 RepID=UPI00397085CB